LQIHRLQITASILQIRRPPYRRSFANPMPPATPLHFANLTLNLSPRMPQAAWYNPRMAKKTTLDSLAALVSKGFASADKKFTALAEDIDDIKKTMATKDDVAEVEIRLGARIDRLDAKIDRVDSKLGGFENHEIDKRLQIEVRVSAIEKHLGINKKIAA
jgi:septal ring factor EnvC (AmiA/AmiB activator)